MTSVLIVDDDDMFRTTLGRDLAKQGFDVSLAQNVHEALAALAGQAIDVLLTDLRMPDADGIDLLASVRSVSSRTRSILMSGFASARDYQRAIEYGAVRVLCKPFTSGELLQAIRQAVDCETGFRGNIHGLSIIDLLQMFHYARRSLAIVVDSWAPGHLYLEEGRIIHAAYRELVGEPALRAILAMPAGSLRTMVLPEATPHTITRDFSTLLLDALRTLDEGQPGAPDDSELGDFDEPSAPPPLAPLEALRNLDGCAAACLVDTSSGVVVGGDCSRRDIDLATAAAGCAELYRYEQDTIRALALDDKLEYLLVTEREHHHILYALPTDAAMCFYLVLDRRAGNLGLAWLALAEAGASVDA